MSAANLDRRVRLRERRRARPRAQVLGASVEPGGSAGFAFIGLADDAAGWLGLVFNQVPEGKAAKNRGHLDLLATALDAEVDRALAAGAGKPGDFDDCGTRWVTLTDPEGKEFDLVAG